MISEADVGNVVIEDEPSCQYSVVFCYHVTDGSRGTLQQMASDLEAHMKQRCVIPPCERNGTH